MKVVEQVYRLVTILLLLLILTLAPLSRQETSISEWIASIESNKTVVLIDASTLDNKLLVEGVDNTDGSILLVIVDLEKLVLTPIKLHSDKELVLHSYLRHNNELLLFYEAGEKGSKHSYIQVIDLLSLNSSVLSLRDIGIRDSTKVGDLIVVAGETRYTKYIPIRPGSPPIAKEEKRITLVAIDGNLSKAYGYWVKCSGRFIGGSIVGLEEVNGKVVLLVSRVENKNSIVLTVDIHHGEVATGFSIPYTIIVLSTYDKHLGLATRDNSVIYGYIDDNSFSYNLFELKEGLIVDGVWMLRDGSIIIEYINTTYYAITPHRYVLIVPTNGKASVYLVETSYPRIQVDILVVHDDYMYLKLEDIAEKKNFIAGIKLEGEKEYTIPNVQLRIKKINNTLTILDNIASYSIQPIKCRLEKYSLELVYVEGVASIEETTIQYNFSKLEVVEDSMEIENTTAIEEVVTNTTTIKIQNQTTTTTRMRESIATNKTTSTAPTTTTTLEPSSDTVKHDTFTEEWGYESSVKRRDIYEAVLVLVYVISSIIVYFLFVKK